MISIKEDIFISNFLTTDSCATTTTLVVLETISLRLVISLWIVFLSFEINKITGNFLSNRAIGPCLISEDRPPSAWIYAISFIFIDDMVILEN